MSDYFLQLVEYPDAVYNSVVFAFLDNQTIVSVSKALLAKLLMYGDSLRSKPQTSWPCSSR